MTTKHDFKTFLTALIALSFASTACAQDIVVGDFEGALDSGWVVTSGSGVVSTNWASSGTSSLALSPNSANAFEWALQFNDIAAIEMLATGTHRLAYDVYWESAEWTDAEGDAWVRWDISALNSDVGGWGQITDNEMDDEANPDFPGSWDPNNWGENHERTIFVDYSSLGYDIDGATWAQFNLAINMGNVEGAGVFYIDNVRLVPVSSGPITVAPSSYEVTRGRYVSGDETSLADSDNVDLGARRSSTDIQSRVEVEIEGTSPTETPTSMTFTHEASVFARTEVTQNIEMYDFVLGDWETIDSQPASRFLDVTVEVVPTGDLSRFVEAGTGVVRARSRFVSSNPRQQFSANIDQMIWVIE